MFRFLPLINSSVTIGLNFLLLIISSNTINTSCSLSGMYPHKYHSYHLSVKALELLRFSKPTSLRLLINNLYFASYGSLVYK